MDPTGFIIMAFIIGSLAFVGFVIRFAANSEKVILIEGEYYKLPSGRRIKIFSVSKYAKRVGYCFDDDSYNLNHMDLDDAQRILVPYTKPNEKPLHNPSE